MSFKPEIIKVACYNILADGWLDVCKPIFLGLWEKRKVELVNRIDNLNADVICMQEVDRFNDLAHLLFERRYIGYRVPDKDVAIFYKADRFKVLSTESLHYSDHLWRSALLLKLQSVNGGTPFNVISTHVTWKPEFDLKQMQQLQEFVSQHKEDPTILCGDLNATPDWAPLQNLCRAGFQDSLRNSSKKTYIDQNRRLDYIFVSKGIHARTADVDGEPKKLTTADEPSDHLPIIAELVIHSGLQTYNEQKPDTIGDKLFKALNEKMKLQEHTQEDYIAIAHSFHLLIDSVKETNGSILDNILLKLDAPLMNEVKAVICDAIRHYENEHLQEIISLLQIGQTNEALSQFSQLSEQLRRQIYFSVYEVEKRNGRKISHSNFGEVAFHSRDNLDVSNDVRVKAIERFLLREVLVLLNADKENEAIPLFKTLSADPIRNSIYGETYAAAKKRSLTNEHSDFGKVAFHRLEKCDVPTDLRPEAIQSYLSKTGI